jgi:hypothetical protein
MKDSTNFNMYPRGVHDAQSAVRLDIRAPGDDAESSVESDDDARGESPAHIEAQLAGPAARVRAAPSNQAQSTVQRPSTEGGQQPSRIPIPSNRVPVRDHWAMVPIEQGEPVETSCWTEIEDWKTG